jgi:hypothetical protein
VVAARDEGKKGPVLFRGQRRHESCQRDSDVDKVMWRRVIRTFAAAAVAAVAVSQPAKATSQEGDLSVHASPTVMAEPGIVRLLIRLERDETNRALVVEVASQDLFRSSLVSLDGAAAPAVHWLRFGSLPAGEYDVTVTLLRNDESSSIARSEFIVSG